MIDYIFRAENPYDISMLISHLNFDQGVLWQLSSNEHGCTAVLRVTGLLTLEELRNLMKKSEGGRLMQESVVPLDNSTGQRTFWNENF